VRLRAGTRHRRDLNSRELPARLAAGPTAAYAATKRGLAYAAAHDLTDSLEREALLHAWLAEIYDHRAATLAFVRKEQSTYRYR